MAMTSAAVATMAKRGVIHNALPASVMSTMAMPPPRGVGAVCELRSFGWSRIALCSAQARIKPTRMAEAPHASPKMTAASMPATCYR